MVKSVYPIIENFPNFQGGLFYLRKIPGKKVDSKQTAVFFFKRKQCIQNGKKGIEIFHYGLGRYTSREDKKAHKWWLGDYENIVMKSFPLRRNV